MDQFQAATDDPAMDQPQAGVSAIDQSQTATNVPAKDQSQAATSEYQKIMVDQYNKYRKYIILLDDRVQVWMLKMSQGLTLGVIGWMSISERCATQSLQTDVDSLSAPSVVGNNLVVQWLSCSVTVKGAQGKSW